ncbi:MAG: hypothetical protein IPK68_14215 [Bdellovibrionales bacterium]|nr:hypothetical protein [Bdellovibrionales bacterium]
MENLYPSSPENIPQPPGVYSPIKIRCPECLKLYAIDPEEIMNSKPKFQCIHCKTKFWMAFPESLGQAGEIIGNRLEWPEKGLKPPPETQINAPRHDLKEAREPEVPAEKSLGPSFVAKPANKNPELSTDPCPKCKVPIVRGIQECPHCGILVQKFLAFQKLRDEEEQGFPASKELRAYWATLIDKYDDQECHQKFIRLCQGERNLVYASRQYGKILAAYSGDETANKMRTQILALSQLSAAAIRVGKKPALNRYSWNLSNFIILLSVILITVGLFLEPWRNMVGVGVALIFFTLAFAKR